jgi:stage II sporulation protein R
MHIKTNKRHGALILTLAFFLAALILLGTTYLPVHGEEQIYDAVIRLHVLANSDSEQDQALKLQVRDAVLSVTTEALEGCVDRAEAERRLHALLPALITAAEQSLRESDCEDKVTVALGQEDYPTRNYDSFCFPSGEYLSLRVMIGEAQGQNFWCVLFPPLCMSAATVTSEEAEEEFIQVGLSKDQYAIITETQNTKYKLRFKFLETLQDWFS